MQQLQRGRPLRIVRLQGFGAAQERFGVGGDLAARLNDQVLLVGSGFGSVRDEVSQFRAHGANEGLHLAEFERVVLAEALLLRNLAQ